jgi:hypothetical protein
MSWTAPETQRTLDAAEVDPANVAALVEAKDGAGLVEGDVLRQADDIPVESASDVVELSLRQCPDASNQQQVACTYVGEDKGLGRVKPNGNNVLDIAVAVPLNLLDGPLL